MFKFPFSLNFLHNTSLSINSDFSILKSLAKWEKETFSETFEKIFKTTLDIRCKYRDMLEEEAS